MIFRILIIFIGLKIVKIAHEDCLILMHNILVTRHIRKNIDVLNILVNLVYQEISNDLKIQIRIFTILYN